MSDGDRCKAIAELNDQFRKDPINTKGKVLITHSVNSHGSDFVNQALAAIQAFDAFTSDTDPYGEHDMGEVEINLVRVWFKFSYYDNALTFGSEDPSNDEITTRVMTIMLPSDY